MLDLLTSPDGFFEERTPEAALLAPAAVVLLVGLIRALGALPAMQMTVKALPEGASGFGSVVVASGVIGGFIGVLVAWVLYAGAFHLISGLLYEPDNGFRDTLAVTGWGFVPAIIAAIVGAVVAFAVFGDVAAPSATDPAQVQRFVQELRSRPAFLVSSALGIVFLLWQAFLWAFGVKHARGLTLRQAGVTVAAPVAVALALRLWSLVG